MTQVKKQHTERAISFLTEELKVSNVAEASDRIFFVSAREALASRINQERGTPTPSKWHILIILLLVLLLLLRTLACYILVLFACMLENHNRIDTSVELHVLGFLTNCFLLLLSYRWPIARRLPGTIV